MLQTVEFVWRTSHSFVRIFLKLLYHRTVVLVEFCAVIGITFISWPTNIKWGSVSKKEFFFLNSWEHEFYNECSFLLDCMNWSLMTVKWGIHYYIFIVLLVILSFISTSHHLLLSLSSVSCPLALVFAFASPPLCPLLLALPSYTPFFTLSLAQAVAPSLTSSYPSILFLFRWYNAWLKSNSFPWIVLRFCFTPRFYPCA